MSQRRYRKNLDEYYILNYYLLILMYQIFIFLPNSLSAKEQIKRVNVTHVFFFLKVGKISTKQY